LKATSYEIPPHENLAQASQPHAPLPHLAGKSTL